MNSCLNQRAFTFTELLISISIVVVIAGGIIIAMSRGATNVHRGSFNATASNQASWIVTIMRRDIARSDMDKISFKPDSGTKWTGSGEFTVDLNSGEKVSYSIEKRGGGKAFCRSESGGKKLFLAAEYLSDISVELADGSFKINMQLIDPGKKANDFLWSARIFPPVPSGVDRFWKPLSEIK
ncbi:MAG: hypothetical protein Kow0029_10190 [Candidatus Rifleibacteriota bacterium]